MQLETVAPERTMPLSRPRKSDNYGSQLGSDTVVGYVDKVMEIILDESNQIDDETWKSDTGETCGVDIGKPNNPVLTTTARIEKAPNQAHMFPEV
ncbi:MAG TPA: hypothetical protein VFS90_01365 [Pyrinomonadaceae bacterium]|nr:hypothetical protein [Pyrinomonadaceae bacterium]